MEYDLTKFTPDTRCLNDMRNVIYDQDWLKIAPNFELYSMYRGLEKKDILRYDITVIPAKMLGLEFVKTKGHYHIGKYQEVYIVLEGKAIYLMQTLSDDKDGIKDVYAVNAQKGDVVIIPPYYGHVTINPSENEDLKMANWVSDNCKSDYSLYEKLQGACYYYTLLPDSERTEWVKNKNYKNIPPLRFEKPLKSIPEDLGFLKNG